MRTVEGRTECAAATAVSPCGCCRSALPSPPRTLAVLAFPGACSGLELGVRTLQSPLFSGSSPRFVIPYVFFFATALLRVVAPVQVDVRQAVGGVLRLRHLVVVEEVPFAVLLHVCNVVPARCVLSDVRHHRRERVLRRPIRELTARARRLRSSGRRSVVIAAVVLVREQPVGRALRRPTRCAQRLLHEPLREAEARQHLHVSLVERRSAARGGRRGRRSGRSVEVCVFHVCEDPLRRSLEARVLHSDTRLRAAVGAEAHRNKALQNHIVRGNLLRGGRRSGGVGVGKRHLAVLQRVCAAQARQVQLLRHGHLDLHLLRLPLVGDVVAPEVDRQTLRERLDPRRGRCVRDGSEGHRARLKKLGHKLIEGHDRQRRRRLLALRLAALLPPHPLRVARLVLLRRLGHPQAQHVVALRRVPHTPRRLTLHALHQVVLERGQRRRAAGQPGLPTRLCAVHPVQKVAEVLLCVLLAHGGELLVPLPDNVLQHPRPHLPRRILSLLAERAAGAARQRLHHLRQLREQVVPRVVAGGREQPFTALACVAGDYFRNRRQRLQRRRHVAAVAEVRQPLEAGAGGRLQVLVVLEDARGVPLQVELQAQLLRGAHRLLLLHNVNAEVRQVLRQLRVAARPVLLRVVRVHVRAARRDRAQLHHQRVLAPRFLEVCQGPAAATRPVPVLATSTDEARRQVEPQVLLVAADPARPRRRVRRDARRVLHLREVCGEAAVLVGVVVLPRGDLLLERGALARHHRVARVKDEGRQRVAQRHERRCVAAAPARRQHREVVLLHDVVGVAAAEAALHADRQAGRLLVGPVRRLRLLLRDAPPRLVQEERFALGRGVGAEAGGAVALPRCEGDEEAARGEGVLEGEHALVFEHAVELGGNLDCAHALADHIEKLLGDRHWLLCGVRFSQ
eukprot:Rhum_TRINITY_DN24877_c0_g1::Rhum_TRINITY_DN24877_c0_g1_i1::g.180328::m.180328